MTQVSPLPQVADDLTRRNVRARVPRFRHWSTIGCLLVAAASLIACWRAHGRAARAEFLLDRTDTADLLRQQQIDELFTQQLALIDLEEGLTEAQRTTLETWFRYDQRFIQDHDGDPTRKYERATAHARSGKIDALRGNPEQGSLHLRATITLLKELMVENPHTVGYHDELAAAYESLGEILVAAGDDSAGTAARAVSRRGPCGIRYLADESATRSDSVGDVRTDI